MKSKQWSKNKVAKWWEEEYQGKSLQNSHQFVIYISIMMAKGPSGGVAEEKLQIVLRKKVKSIHTFCSNSNNHTHIYIYDQIRQKIGCDKH